MRAEKPLKQRARVGLDRIRPCLELIGITDILSKAYGSTSPKNLVKATLDALRQLQNRDQVESTRGVKLERTAGELVTAE